MRGKFDEKYAVELPADILRFPPVSLHEKEILITTEYAQVKIENPLTITAWRVLLGLLRYGKEEKRDPTMGLRVSIESSPLYRQISQLLRYLPIHTQVGPAEGLGYSQGTP